MKNNSYHLLLVVVTLIGIALWGIAFGWTYGDDNPNDLVVHLGETGATLVILMILGHVVKTAFSERENMRKNEDEKREFYRNMLADFKSVYDRVESCRLLVEAHQSAKTYGNQVRELVGAVVILHNVKRALDPEFPKLKKELATPIRMMTAFVKALLTEFRDEYRRISHLQEADDAWNRSAREKLLKEGKSVEDYTPISRSWTEIKKLPKLAALRDDQRFAEYEHKFLDYLDEASVKLRQRLPVKE